MATTIDKVIKRLPSKRRAKIKARTAELIAEEMTLRDLRNAMELTQKRMAEMLGIGQDSVSRLEQRSDLLLSTLQSYVEAMGGTLHVIHSSAWKPALLSAEGNAAPSFLG